MPYATPQEQFWSGEFGDAYSTRNVGEKVVGSKIALFSRILSRAIGVESVIEFGANIGLNMLAIKALLPGASLQAIEINEQAFKSLRSIEGVRASLGSILDFQGQAIADLAFTAGVLIHINPEMVSRVYEVLYKASRRYVLVYEYYNTSPVEVDYRGHSGKLFKRDWAGEMMSAYPDLALLDYGFVYRRDPVFPDDDVTWFLMEKRV